MSTLAVALTGNPNTGKSTIFNELTGARQKIGNWPGVTVDKKVGYTRYKDRAISIVDLPGTYSVNARSPEEKIVIDYLMNNKLDLVMDVVDSSNIERNLFLTVQLLEQGIPLLIDLNMQDDAKRRGIKIDTKKLEEAIGMPVVETVGRSSKSTKKLLDVFTSTVMSKYHVSPQVQEHIDKVQAIQASSRSESEKEEAIIEARYALIDKIMAQAVDTGNVGQSMSEKIDHFLANGVLALPIFLLILYAVFQITFTWIGQPIADFLDDAINTQFVGFMEDFLTDAGVADWMVSLVCDGIISGVGAVLTFVPLIFVLFFCLSFLDGTGYMARIAFIMDPIMRRCGLTGKGVMPLMMGFGYGTGAIMAVPAHDDRDWEFAKKFGCEIIEVVSGGEDVQKAAFTAKDETGILVNSDFLNGKTVKDAIPAMIEWLGEKGIGHAKVQYKLRDWVFSRQRYWGEPIPIVKCDKCGYVALPEDQLPLELPNVTSYEPTDNGESPLAHMTDWVNTTCPCCGGPAKRETDTMPQWAGSSWYFLRYMDPH
ncbi:ferrous iron transport protein B, partial [Mitsuokella jalaludinii]|uniref:ferrous iron transport protein B n=1 Tax=Mitsuokella jalaludinii TaxID=187979 RepID=UPI00307D6893